MIDQATIQKIFDAADIYEVVSDFVSLKKRGVNYLGLCPFHNEKTGSFTVSPAKGIYKCFGCGKGGNAVNFIMEHEQMSYVEALKYLAEKYHIPVEEKELTEEQKKEKSEEKGEIQVAVLTNAYTMNSGQNIIYSGIQDAIEQEKTGETKFSVSYITVDDTNTFSVEESIRDIFMEERLPDIIICLNELNTTCVYQAVVDYNQVGQISILGYYDSDTIINAIDRNVVNATISIDTEQMGGFCVEALTEYYLLGNTSQYFTADVTLIDKSNVAQYLEGGDEDEN